MTLAAPRLGLAARLGIIATVLAAETLLGSYFIQLSPLDALAGAPGVVHVIQHWLFRFIIAYAISLCMLAYQRGGVYAAADAVVEQARVRWGWAAAHTLLLVPFGYLSLRLYAAQSAISFAALALAWHACAAAAAAALFAALAPLCAWRDVARQMRGLALFATLPALAAVAAIKASQTLWGPAAHITFRLVRMLLLPLLPGLRSDPAQLVLGTPHFAVQIAQVCSGLEGIGLVLAFCAGWLWLFRRDYYFPRALLVVPVGVLVVYLLNLVRIAAVVLIGNAGYDRVAMLGFHSQAGWIAFNLTAFGIAAAAHHTPWLSRVARRGRADRAQRAAAAASRTGNATAAYLMPLLVVLATGMASRALSAGFEFLYALRFLGALATLWLYRTSYRDLNWRCTWRAPAVGLIVFCLWIGAATVVSRPPGIPGALAVLPAPFRAGWIACRVLAAVLTVPIAEELAYRGYLLRRLTSPRFAAVPLSEVRWPAIAVSAAAFGVTHGVMWLPGIAAGLAYGGLAVRTGKFGEAVVAHGTTNALLAAYVLMFGQWQLW